MTVLNILNIHPRFPRDLRMVEARKLMVSVTVVDGKDVCLGDLPSAWEGDGKLLIAVSGFLA